MDIYLVYALWRTSNGLAEMPSEVMPFSDSQKAVDHANKIIDDFVEDYNYVQAYPEDESAHFTDANSATRTYRDPEEEWAYVEIYLDKKTLERR